jgi:hypothetical protein
MKWIATFTAALGRQPGSANYSPGRRRSLEGSQLSSGNMAGQDLAWHGRSDGNRAYTFVMDLNGHIYWLGIPAAPDAKGLPASSVSTAICSTSTRTRLENPSKRSTSTMKAT